MTTPAGLLATLDALDREAKTLGHRDALECELRRALWDAWRSGELRWALEDRVRLDWLSQRDGAFEHIGFGNYDHYWHQSPDTRNGRLGLREAIDTAIGDAQGGGGKA